MNVLLGAYGSALYFPEIGGLSFYFRDRAIRAQLVLTTSRGGHPWWSISMDSSPHILVVDDFAPNRAAYRGWLEHVEGVTVIEAATGELALALVREQDFALFVFDINMPDMDGFELASLVRQEPRAAGTPIMFVTSEHTARPYLLRGYRMGAVDVLMLGPVEGEILVQKARVFIRLYAKRVALQQEIERVGGENQVLRARIEGFLSNQEQLRDKASLDPLTQLPNRILFRDRVEAAMRRAQRSCQRFGLAYVDLDGFKAVNDRYGHAAGDALIVSVGQRLEHSVRATDTVARLGGDEFGMVIEELDGPSAAAHVAEKIHAALCEPFTVAVENQSPVDISTGASIGVALYPDHAADHAELVKLADLTMYAAKRAGGGAGVFRHDSWPPPDRSAPDLQLVTQRP